MQLIFFSRALKEADIIVLLGARLNWILHFGKSPRFSTNVKFIQVSVEIEMCTMNSYVGMQVDISPEEMGNNALDPIKLVGDVGVVVKQVSIIVVVFSSHGESDYVRTWLSPLMHSAHNYSEKFVEGVINSLQYFFFQGQPTTIINYSQGRIQRG